MYKVPLESPFRKGFFLCIKPTHETIYSRLILKVQIILTLLCYMKLGTDTGYNLKNGSNSMYLHVWLLCMFYTDTCQTP